MAAILAGSYNPSEVIVTVGGVLVDGFSDGDFLTVRRAEELYFNRVGADGEVARARNANKMGEFEFRLMQTSKANRLLSVYFNLEDLGNDALRSIPITVLDGSGTSLAVATQCWAKQMPDMMFNKNITERIWIFSAADLKIFHGGN